MDAMHRSRQVAVQPAEPAAKDRLRLWLRLLRLTRQVEGELRERLRTEFGTTLPRFDVLAALYRSSDGMTMTELSRMLMVSNGNVTGIVERLVEDGLVSRTIRDGDRRASIVSLTDGGARTFEDLACMHRRWVDKLLSDFDAEETGMMIALIDRAVNHGEGERCRPERWPD
jgi:DNA-binding MarR family transcriptional regulator